MHALLIINEFFSWKRIFRKAFLHCRFQGKTLHFLLVRIIFKEKCPKCNSGKFFSSFFWVSSYLDDIATLEVCKKIQRWRDKPNDPNFRYSMIWKFWHTSRNFHTLQTFFRQTHLDLSIRNRSEFSAVFWGCLLSSFSSRHRNLSGNLNRFYLVGVWMIYYIRHFWRNCHRDFWAVWCSACQKLTIRANHPWCLLKGPTKNSSKPKEQRFFTITQIELWKLDLWDGQIPNDTDIFFTHFLRQ